MVAEIDALISEVRKFRSSQRAEPVLQRILETYIPAWQAVNSIAGGLPAGGMTGQALVKASNANYDTVWATIAAVPVGNDTDVQFNDNGVFGGNDFFVYNKTLGHASLGNIAVLEDSKVFSIRASTADPLLGLNVDMRNSDAIFGDLKAANFQVITLGGNLASTTGLTLNISSLNDGTITSAIALSSEINNSDACVITTGYGFLVKSNTNGGGSTFSNNYGIFIQDQSAVGSVLSYNIFSAGTGKNHFHGGVEVATAASIIKSTVNLTDGAGAGAGTLGTAPVAGDPTKWIGINDNGVIRYVPAWNA